MSHVPGRLPPRAASDAAEPERATELALAESEERYRRLLELSADAVVVHLGGKVLYVNTAAAQLVGAESPEQLIGRSVLDFVHPDHRDAVIERMRKVQEEGGAVEPMEQRLVRLDGSTIDVSVSGVAVSYRGRRASQLLVRDVSDRRRVTAVLEETERKFRQLFESSLDAVAINILPEGRYLEVNTEFERLTGFRREAVLGRTPAELGIWADASAHDEAMKELRWQKVVRNVEARLRSSDGTMGWMLYSAVVVELGGQLAILSFARNITSLKRVEEELSRARDQALEASRIKSTFISNMSHEIRTPLNIMLGYTSLISDHLMEGGDESQQPLFEAIRSAGKRLVRNIDGILDLSKIESGMFPVHPRSIRLRPVFDRLVEEYSPVARKKGLSLTLSLREDDPAVYFDEYCLHHALGNLLDNALKFTDRGSVSMRVYRGPDGQLTFEIRDTGVGMDKEYLSRLFEPFSQESSGDARRFEGAGVSLALTKKYLELNGGRIEVESQKRWGSTFRVRFAGSGRFREDEALPATEKPAPAVPPKPVVLVVEDDPDTQTYMKLLLRNQYDVLVASDADAARQELDTHAGDIRIVLMDLSLAGGETGLTLTRTLRKDPRWREVPIIATTAHALSEHRAKALEAGCTAYLSKPFDYEELLAMMREMVVSTANA